ncbi:MAG: hypothetical protein O2V44_06980, partial [Candidatus Bathyarchaeota archaeon]|nr:hypothetical protein [Candidatus Bathyarchaeota archaeon]
RAQETCETVLKRESYNYSGFEMSTKKETVDLELHITAKNLAILQGKIACILKELVKKAKLLHEKEEGEEANHLLGMISDNLNELSELFEHRKELRNQIENLKRIESDLIRG